MPPTAQNPASTKTPLDAAQKIVAELQGMAKDHQALAVKFAMETLGHQLPPTHAPMTPPPVGPQLGIQFAPAGTPGHTVDIKAFTTAKAPTSDQQFAAVVAYFYQFEAKPEDRREFIDPETMKEAARLAGRAQVTRWAMTLTNAKNAGYLDPAGSGKYKLSPVGENLVAITLPGNAGGTQATRGGSSKKKRKK